MHDCFLHNPGSSITATPGGSTRWVCVQTVGQKNYEKVDKSSQPLKTTTAKKKNPSGKLKFSLPFDFKSQISASRSATQPSQQQNTTQQKDERAGIKKITPTKRSPIRDRHGDKSNYLRLMLQICSNGRSVKVNKCLRRGNKRMWFLINLKEERRDDLVNPSFICCLGPLICLLHNVVFDGKESVCRCVCMRANGNVNRFSSACAAFFFSLFFGRFYCSLSFAAPPPVVLLSHLFSSAPFTGILALKITKGWGNN